MRCPKCGTRVTELDKEYYCPNCGRVEIDWKELTEQEKREAGYIG